MEGLDSTTTPLSQ